MEEDILDEIEPLILYDTQDEREDEKANEVDPLAVDPSETKTSEPITMHANVELPAFEGKVVCTPVQPLEVVEVLEVAVDVMKDENWEIEETSENKECKNSQLSSISIKRAEELRDSGKRTSFDPVVPERPTKMHECPTCGRRVKDKSNFNKHLRTHKGIKHFTCEICHWKFSEPVDLRMHMRTHTDGKPFKCDICGIAFARSWNLKSHRHVHFRSRQKCELCGASFTLLSSLKIHQQKAHIGLSLFPCQKCGKTFPRPSNISDLICCSSCSGNSSKVSASGHLQNGKSFFVCIDCGNIFEDMSSLHEHRVKVHRATESKQLLHLPYLKPGTKLVPDSM